MRDLALPAPGTEEPIEKPSQAKLGAKPTLPPPAKDLTKESVENAAKQAAAAAAAAADIPLMTEAPPPDLRVEKEALKPQPMRREKSKSKSASVKIKKPKGKPKTKHTALIFDDSEVAVVARDPRKSREHNE